MRNSHTFTRLCSALLATSLIFALGCSDDDDSNNKSNTNNSNTNKSNTMATSTGTSIVTNTMATGTNTMATGNTNVTNTMATSTSTSTSTGTSTGGMGARAQVLHLVQGAGAVDVYVGGERVLDDFAEFTATPFIDLPAGNALEVKIFAGADPDDSGTALISGTVTPEAGKAYTIAAAGNPAVAAGMPEALELLVGEGALETGADAAQVSARIVHASPGVGEVALINVGLPAAGPSDQLAEDVPFGAISADYLALPTTGLPYGSAAVLDILDKQDDFVTNAQIPDLTAFAGSALTIAAVGSAVDDSFELIAFAADGTKVVLEKGARAQLIHNSPTTGAVEEVDVLIKLGDNYQPFVNDLGYRKATPFVSIPSGGALTVGVDADDDATTVDVPDIVTPNVSPGATLALVASGIVGDATTPFNLAVSPAEEAGAVLPGMDTPNSVGATFFHGSPNAPSVGVRVAGTTDALFPTFTYLDTEGPVIILKSVKGVLEIYAGTDGDSDATGDAVLKTASEVDFSTLPTKVFVLASGLLGDADKPLGLIVVTEEGAVVTLPLESP